MYPVLSEVEGKSVAIAWSKILPVVVSIGIIILVAVLREYSRSLAAIAATMPINLPLALWIIYSAVGGDREVMATFTQALFVNIWPTILFILVTWITARAGWSLIPMLIAGYVAWGVGLGIIYVLRIFFGG
jgi:hypothetical protein